MCPERKWKGQTMRHSGLGEWREKKAAAAGCRFFRSVKRCRGNLLLTPGDGQLNHALLAAERSVDHVP